MQNQVMTTEEIIKTLHVVFKTLNQLKATEISESDTGLGDAPEKPATDPKRSILKKNICLECGAEFKQLSAKHLASHGLTSKEYR